MTKRIAFLGPKGTFSEEAALHYEPNARFQPFPTIFAVGLSVAHGDVEEGVVPIENSLGGSVPETLDLLIQEDRLSIRRELILPIRHFLMVKPGTNVSDIQTVYSHYQALAQCQNYLEKNFPEAEQVSSLSTAAAVADMLKSNISSAAIGGRRAAQLQGAEVLYKDIQDNLTNVTRFVILARQDHEPTGIDKTSLCFSFREDKPGVLYNALGEFVQRKINLAKIESRPTKESLGKYIFLVDCEGHRQDSLVKEILDKLRGQTSLLRIFGSYPRWEDENS